MIIHSPVLTTRCGKCKTHLEAVARFCVECGAPIETPIVINDRYLLEGKLGEGGFSTVARARQLTTGREVALKFPRFRDAEIYARFEREAVILGRLRDPHTVTVFDFDRTPGGMPFIVMEMLEGVTLRNVLRRCGPMRWERMCRLIRQICTALRELHATRFVHRDLKPDNIFLDHRSGRERIKVLDFGIAKAMQAQPTHGEELTAAGTTVGTLEYMSPEQLMGEPLDGRSDIYAIGALAYELVSGRHAHASPPFDEHPPEPIANVPVAVYDVIRRCLSRHREDRFADVGILARALEELRVAAHTIADPEEATRHVARRWLRPSAMSTIPDPRRTVAAD